MNHEKIRLYVLSVVRYLPRQMKKEVAQELQSLVSDMLEKRCGDVLPDERDVDVVLAELGNPVKLAEKYQSAPIALISSAYYAAYRIALKITLLSIVFGVTLGSCIELFSDNGVAWYVSIAYWAGRLALSFFLAFGIVTFIFAVIERSVNSKIV